MNVLLVYAHPEPRSLHGALKDFTVQHLQMAGHAVEVSDLYAMQWKTTLDAADNLDYRTGDRFDASLDSMHAFMHGRQSPDIAREQDKLLWADMLILQFPLWWSSMPAILKGWIDRVYACGFAYDVGEHSDTHWGDRYGEGTLAGKHAMLIVSAGGWASHFSPRGINGPIDDILFPIQHGTLYYAGMDVLPPFVVYRTDKMDKDRFTTTCDALAGRLDSLAQTAPIAYRRQNDGDYEIPALTLREEIAPEMTGFSIHIK